MSGMQNNEHFLQRVEQYKPRNDDEEYDRFNSNFDDFQKNYDNKQYSMNGGYQQASRFSQSSIAQQLNLKNLQYESQINKLDDNEIQKHQRSYLGQNEVQKHNGEDKFEEHFEESEDSRMMFNERENDQNITIRQSSQLNLIAEQRISNLEQQKQKQQQLTTSVNIVGSNYKPKQVMKQVDINQIDLDDQQARAIQMIYVENNKFIVNPQLDQLLQKYQKYKISFVIIGGKYRTGKSFLLNQLLNIKGKGFQVESQTQACTQGIWIWSQPLLEKNNNTCVFFMDSEGTGSIEKNNNHDQKIFALALLISNLYIFNSVGCIDDSSISQLQLTTTITKNIMNQTNKSSQEVISDYIPKFIWLLRDFVLQMEDQNGKPIDASTYMENQLNDESVISKQSQQSRSIRKSMLTFFEDRECVALIRPVTDEQDLKNLNNLPNHVLKKEFIQQMNSLRTKIIQKCEPFKLNNMYLEPQMYLALVQGYVDVINSKGVPQIETALDFMHQNVCQKAFQNAIELYRQSISKCFEDEQPKDTSEVYQIFISERLNANQNYVDQTGQLHDSQYFKEYQNKLNNQLKQLESSMLDTNDKLSADLCEELLKYASKEMKARLEKQQYNVEQIDKFQNDFNQFLKVYKTKSKGDQKMNILIKFLSNFMGFSIKSMTQSVQGNNQISQIEMNHSNKEIQDLKKYNSNLKSLNEELQLQVSQQQQQPTSNDQAIKTELRQQKQKNMQLEQQVVEVQNTNKIKEQQIKQYREQMENMKKQKSACCSIF